MGQNIQRVAFHLYFCCAMIITSGPKQNLKKQNGPWKGRHPTLEAMQPRLLCFRRNGLPQLIFHWKFLLYTNIACGPLEKIHSKNQAKPVDMLTGGNCETFRKNCSFGKRAVPCSNKDSVDMSICRGPQLSTGELLNNVQHSKANPALQSKAISRHYSAFFIIFSCWLRRPQKGGLPHRMT